MDKIEPLTIPMPKSPQASRDYLRLLYSLGDFQLALSAAAFLGDCDPDAKYSKIELRRFRCYETTVIVAYTRPFSQSKGGIPPLTLKMTGAILSRDQKELHRKQCNCGIRSLPIQMPK